MARVALVTDSSVCLPAELIHRYQIMVVPLAFLFNGEIHYDGSLSSREFYALLRTSRRFPTTTSPAPGEFLKAYREARKRGAQAVLCLTLASRYSGTYSSAVNAREIAQQEMPGFPIQVVDTGGLAMSFGFAVLAAARALERGLGLEKAAEVAARVGPRCHLIGMLDTLRYLARSGRVPWIVHWATSALQIKPILSAQSGDIRALERVRTRERALDRLLHHLGVRIEPGRPLHVAVMHADAEERARSLAEEIQSRFRPRELLLTEFTSVMGVHTGPGFIGIAFYCHDDALLPVEGERGEAPPSGLPQLEEDVRRLEASLGPLPPPRNPPALVVVSGLPGSGKSHFTRTLCQRYPMARLDSDALRKALFGRPTHSPEESRRLFAACHALLDRLLSRGIPAVLDATNLREIHRRPLYAIAEGNGARLFLIQVQAPPQVVRERLTARLQGLNPWDQSEAGPEVYERMRRYMEPIERPHLVVDTSQDIGPAVERLARELEGLPV